MLGLLQCWHFCQAKLIVKNICQNLEGAVKKMEGFEDVIQSNIQEAKDLEKEIEEMTKIAQSVMSCLIYFALVKFPKSVYLHN